MFKIKITMSFREEFISAYSSNNNEKVLLLLKQDSELLKELTNNPKYIPKWNCFSMVLKFLSQNQNYITNFFSEFVKCHYGNNFSLRFSESMEEFFQENTKITREFLSKIDLLSLKDSYVYSHTMVSFALDIGIFDETVSRFIASKCTLLYSLVSYNQESFKLLYQIGWYNFHEDIDLLVCYMTAILNRDSKFFLELYNKYHSLFTMEQINGFLIPTNRQDNIDIARILLRDPRCDITYNYHEVLRIVFIRQSSLEIFKLLLSNPDININQITIGGFRDLGMSFYVDTEWLIEIFKHPSFDSEELVMKAFHMGDKDAAHFLMTTEWFVNHTFSKYHQTTLVIFSMNSFETLQKLLRFPNFNNFDIEEVINRAFSPDKITSESWKLLLSSEILERLNIDSDKIEKILKIKNNTL